MSSGKSGLAWAGILSEIAASRDSMSRRASTSDDFHVARWSSRCVDSDSINRRVEAGSTDIRLLTAPVLGPFGVVSRHYIQTERLGVLFDPPIDGGRPGP